MVINFAKPAKENRTTELPKNGLKHLQGMCYTKFEKLKNGPGWTSHSDGFFF